MAQEAAGLSHIVDTRGVLRITFDTPGRKVNLLDAAILAEISRLVDEARDRDDVRGVLFRSDKRGMFVAGMDVASIAAIDETYRAAEGARMGQAVLQKIAALAKPSVAAIGGTCLGGGTELALACTFRVASAERAVEIGLPEVRLGIIPGFGGTQRLPHVVGLAAALDLILTGRSARGREALRLGLVDRLVPQAYLDREALALLYRAAERGTSEVIAGLGRPHRLVAGWIAACGPARRLLLGQARKRAARRADPVHYPAPFRAIDAVDAAFARPLAHGLDFEASLIGELIPTPTAKNLIWLFQSQTELKAAPPVQAAPRRVRRIAILGAGIMGGGIARLAADGGLTVRLKDLRQEALLQALREARRLWQRDVDRRRLAPRELEQRMAAIAPTLDDTGLGNVDVVIEAVVEQLAVKQRVLAAVEERSLERTVFATNTSSLPIDEIAARALRPDRVVGLHFFNPVQRMPLVEIIAGRRTSPETVATAHALAVRLGKMPVLVRDSPGFLVNRILSLYLNEAMQLLSEGARIEAIDQSMVRFGMPLGPLALLDQIGLDTSRHVSEVLQGAFGRRVGSSAAVVAALVDAGRLGQKGGRGFYRWRDGEPGAPEHAVYGLVGAAPARDIPAEMLQERMVLAMLNEAVLCLQEEVAREPRDVDMALVMGTGFPPFRGGLLRWADATGVPLVADRLARLADAHGERFRPAATLATMVREQRRFYETR